jgi:hypothetical protein
VELLIQSVEFGFLGDGLGEVSPLARGHCERAKRAGVESDTNLNLTRRKKIKEQ